MLTDTHTHMNAEQFNEDRDAAIQRALDAGITRIVNIGMGRDYTPSSIGLAEKYDFVWSTVGWHPQDAATMQDGDLEWLEEMSRHPKVVMIGEIGLDYHWDTSPRDVQQRVFRDQIRLARKVGLPISIHDRDAHHDVVTILREEGAAEVGGIMHCFSGSWETARMCLDMNFYISFGGPITFKNAKQPKEVLANVPLDRLLIETDAPYLTPHPHRGKRNETAYARLVAEAAAKLKDISLEELAEATTTNALRLMTKMK